MFCPKCGTPNDSSAFRCVRCQEAMQPQHAQQGYGPYAPPIAQPPSRGLGDDAAMRLLLPVGRSGLAIVAGYLGIFSLFLPVGPIAILVAVLAIRDIKAHPEKHGMGRAIFAIIAGGIATLILLALIVHAAVR